MRIYPISDIHLEYCQDAGLAFYQQVMQVEADVCVVAGDLIPLADPRYQEVLPLVLQVLTNQFPVVVYVLGNHEFYRGRLDHLDRLVAELPTIYPNLHILETDTVTVDGVTFAGATLWFPNQSGNERFYEDMDDFQVIHRLSEWVYNAHSAAHAFFQTVEADVWVTHHLPSARSIPGRYRKNPLNRFFVSDLTPLIQQRQPRYVIHGHGHSSMHYWINQTQVIANPRGYPDRPNRSFNPILILEL